MNFWKPLALISTSALILGTGVQIASAASAHHDRDQVQGEYRQMRAALENLHSAREHLASSEHNNGHWRERALDATDRAIHETEEAMKWNP